MEEKIKSINLDFVNAYLIILRNEFILIDTGVSQHKERLEKELINEGALPDKLKLVIITHGDADHTGNCAYLQKKYNVKIAMHPGDVLMAEKGIILNRKIRTLPAKIFVIIRKIKRKITGTKLSFDSFKPDILLNDNQSLKDYGFDATVYHLPGHTKGSIGILTKEGNFFAGDIFFNRSKPAISYYIENETELMNSVKKITGMKINTIYPGHGKLFSSGLLDNIK